MKNSPTLQILLITAVILLTPFASARAEEPAAADSNETASAVMTINRFVTCQSVEDREPAGATSTFAADTDTAYAFLEAVGISADVEVNFVWIHADQEVARVPLTIRQGSRWRTYSSKKLAGRPGAWRVEVQDAQSATLASVDFTVE